jgi:hypothetical protein
MRLRWKEALSLLVNTVRSPLNGKEIEAVFFSGYLCVNVNAIKLYGAMVNLNE